MNKTTLTILFFIFFLPTVIMAQYVGPITRNVHYQINKDNYTPLKDFKLKFSDTSVHIKTKKDNMPWEINTYQVNDKSIEVNHFSEYLIIEYNKQLMWIKGPVNRIRGYQEPLIFKPGYFKLPQGFGLYEIVFEEGIKLDESTEDFRVKDTSEHLTKPVLNTSVLNSAEWQYQQQLVDVSFNQEKGLLGLLFSASIHQVDVQVQNQASKEIENWGSVRIDSIAGRLDLSVKNTREAYVSYHKRYPYKNRVFYTNNKGETWQELVNYLYTPVDYYFQNGYTYFCQWNDKEREVSVFRSTDGENAWEEIQKPARIYSFYGFNDKMAFSISGSDCFYGYLISNEKLDYQQAKLCHSLTKSVYDWKNSSYNFVMLAGEQKLFTANTKFIPFVNGKRAVVLGGDYVFYSRDGGKTWKRKFFNESEWVYYRNTLAYEKSIRQVFQMQNEIYSELDGNMIRAYTNQGIFQMDVSTLWE